MNRGRDYGVCLSTEFAHVQSLLAYRVCLSTEFVRVQSLSVKKDSKCSDTREGAESAAGEALATDEWCTKSESGAGWRRSERWSESFENL